MISENHSKDPLEPARENSDLAAIPKLTENAIAKSLPTHQMSLTECSQDSLCGNSAAGLKKYDNLLETSLAGAN